MKVPQDVPDDGRVRLDKWLWAARFFKSRSLAREAVDGGKVRLAGERVKASRELKPGDRLDIQIGEHRWRVTVLALFDRRGPAQVARGLYSEDEESRLERERQVESRQWAADPGAAIKGRPTKRDRRLIHRFNDAG